MVPVGLETNCAGKRTRCNSTRIIRMMRTLLIRLPFRSMSRKTKAVRMNTGFLIF